MVTGGVGARGVGALAGGVGERGTPRGRDPDATGGDSRCGILLIFPRGRGLGRAVGGGVGACFLARITLTGSVGFSKDGDE